MIDFERVILLNEEHSFLRNPLFRITKPKPLANKSIHLGSLSPIIAILIAPFVIELLLLMSQGRDYIE